MPELLALVALIVAFFSRRPRPPKPKPPAQDNSPPEDKPVPPASSAITLPEGFLIWLLFTIAVLALALATAGFDCGRIIRVALGWLAFLLVLAAAALGLRGAKWWPAKLLPFKLLQARHYLLGWMSASATFAHACVASHPYAAWSQALSGCYFLLLVSGYLAMRGRKAAILKKAIEAKSNEERASGGCSPKTEEAREVADGLIEEQFNSLSWHHSATLVVLAFISFHVLFRLIF